ncbi:hypothetical protein CDAR_530581 [Caerostris darwini]|uniref:Uncharacterized protein n=1 Tax=Caerostris darwini TaxID=1538125 RepID=A0AAV4QMP7_9ARAC|nr:hypothetical protein CDAR_530581 [Caerostris darwini]
MVKIICSFLAIIVLEIVSCELICMQKTKFDCHLSFSYCSENNEFLECMRSGARECNLESDPIVQDMLNVIDSTCTEGTEINTLYKKHIGCVTGNVTTSGNKICVKPFSNITPPSSNRTPAESFIEGVRLICK